ncbi:MAG: hypothetical protein ABW162_15885 [Candidatus Sedimenticola sp. PURPLELP]
MKPHFLGDEQRQALELLIDKLRIGDLESRELFIRALEYELAEYEELEEEAEAASAPGISGDSDMLAVSSAVDNLLTALDALTAGKKARITRRLSADDNFSRDHDGRYLSALEIELARLSRACGSESAKTKPASLSAPDQKLIGMMAEAYEECFEKTPSPKKGQPFARLVAGVVDICQLKTPVDEAALSRIIDR